MKLFNSKTLHPKGKPNGTQIVRVSSVVVDGEATISSSSQPRNEYEEASEPIKTVLCDTLMAATACFTLSHINISWKTPAVVEEHC